MPEINNEETNRSSKIQMGTLFAPKKYNIDSDISLNIQMVIDPYAEENAFHAVPVEKMDDQGIAYWNPFSLGTMSPENIGIIVDHLDPETVRKGILEDPRILKNVVEALLVECQKKYHGNWKSKLKIYRRIK